jgi:APA family basic amino acid/polyamine antiporter
LARELVDSTLEDELKTIVRERDEIAMDRFDALVERCAMLDLEQPMNVEAFFRRASAELAKHVGVDADNLLRLLLEREKDTSTVLSPTLAVPHVIIDGTGKFDILIARCRQGVNFSPEAPQIHTLFVVAGTRDQRNFHLRTLSAIAQIVQNPNFERQWMAARNEQALRDIVLLGQRLRGHG